MEFASFVVFESEQLNLSVTVKSPAPARFRSTMGSASGVIEIAKSSNDSQLIEQIQNKLAQSIAFGEVSDVEVWHYFFGIYVVEFRVEVAPTVITQAMILDWDDQTDSLQDVLIGYLKSNVAEEIRSRWSTSLFIGQSGDSMNDVVMNTLPNVTRTVKARPSGFITQGLCGIGISCIEFDPAQDYSTANLSANDIKNQIMQTERNAVAFCAGVYHFHDRLLSEYKEVLDGTKKLKLSKSAMEFRFFESIRMNHDMYLGPNERSINDSLWEVWDMEKLTASVEASAIRLEKEMDNRKKINQGQMQIALGFEAAVIAGLVAVRPLQRIFDLGTNLLSDFLVLGGLGILMSGFPFVWRYISGRKSRD